MSLSRNAFLVSLAALAGWIDALSFSELGQVFTSFQSGNLIFLGLAIDEGDTVTLVGAGISVAAFLVGTAAGGYLVGRARVEWLDRRRLAPAFAAEWAMLVGLGVCWLALGTPAEDSAARVLLVAMAALAMGAQGAAVFALNLRGVVTNAMTATLMLGGVLIGLHAHGRTAAREASPISPALVAAVCGSYTVSAVAVGVIGEPEVAAVVPAGALALLLAGVLGPLRAHAAPGTRAA